MTFDPNNVRHVPGQPLHAEVTIEMRSDIFGVPDPTEEEEAALEAILDALRAELVEIQNRYRSAFGASVLFDSMYDGMGL